MKKFVAYFLIGILLLPTQFAYIPNISAEEIEEDYLEENVVLFSEKEGGEIQLFEDTTDGEELIKIPDNTSVILLNNEDEEYSLISYTYPDVNNTETEVIGYVNHLHVIPLEEAELYLEDRKNLTEPTGDKQAEEDIYAEPEQKTEELIESEDVQASDSPVTEENNVMASKAKINDTKTSKLGHILSGSVKIYENIGGSSKLAGSTYTNAVYYIKLQAKQAGNTYYLISTQPSSTKGTVGWVNAKDLSLHDHVGVDKKSKTFYFNGKGKATTKAWGGSKDTVISNLSSHKGNAFQVHLTEKVGKNTWYRGNYNGKTMWVHSSYVDIDPPETKKSKTSKLGHILSGNVKIYENIGGSSKVAGSTYTNAVYYIKLQAKQAGNTYYLISTQPSSTKGIVGWVNAKDLSIHDHVGVDKKSKTFYFNGKGKATTKAWGGSKDTVISNLSSHKGNAFQVHLTEKVGKNTWYRGSYNGKTMWVHSSYVDSESPQPTVKESNTSKLGHIRSNKVRVYESIGGKSTVAGSSLTNAVYYIKKQAKTKDATYYLISTQPSSTKGLVGWVNAKDLSIHDHVGVDKKAKTFYFNGKGKATTKAWGGSKDTVISSLSSHQGNIFQVHLTEKVGKNTWYRGNYNGKTMWVHSSYVTTTGGQNTDYKITLKNAVNIQMERLKIVNSKATAKEVEAQMDPQKLLNDPVQKFQFLDLSKPSGATVSVLNNYLNKPIYAKGSLKGQGKAFYEASRKHSINEVYLISHARLETGDGTSPLSNGSIQVGELGTNKWMTIQTSSTNAKTIHVVERVKKDSQTDWKVTKNNYLNPNDAKNIKVTYNMFGIGAIDGAANQVGSVTAYLNKWTTPAKAIEGGANWIQRDYINNQHKQKTLYKMRWNPNMNNGYAWKQYATDIEWASKQARIMHNLYKDIGISKGFIFDVPVYK